MVALAAAMGCSSSAKDPCAGVSGACLAITVTSPSIAKVDTLVIAASGAFSGTQQSSRAPSPLPIRLSARYPETATGAVTIDVDALLGGAVVGHGSGSATLVPGKHVAMTIALGGPGGGGDLGSGDGATDLGTDAAPPDMTRPVLSFSTKGPYTVGNNPIDVVLGNFQGKGNVDILAVNSQGMDASVLLQDANGNYPATPQSFSVSGVGNPAGGGVGRWHTGASRQGFIASDGRYAYTAYDNSGANPPTFTQVTGGPTMLGQGTGAIAVGDFDKALGDDVAITVNATGGATASGYGVVVLRSDGAGSFKTTPAPVTYDAGELPSHIATADLRGNGNLDLLVTKGTSNLGILRGNGDGSFATTIENHTVGTNPAFIAVADFNGDQKPDIAVANDGGSVSLLLNDGTGGFPATATPISAGASPHGIAAADLDGDGAVDLAVTNYNGSTVSVLLGDGAGHFAAPVPVTVGSAPSAIAAGDLNADIKPDLVVANQAGGNVTVLINTSH